MKEENKIVQDGVQDTVQDKKEIVRQVLIKTNPHLNNMEKICSECKREVVVSGNRVVRKKPIGLADVLVAIELTNPKSDISIRGFRGIFTPRDINPNGVEWNLSQDFDHQSEAFYLFA